VAKETEMYEADNPAGATPLGSATTEAAAPNSRPLGPQRNRAVLWWALVGAAFVVFQGYVYLSWMASDDFAPRPAGVDPVPQWEKVFAWLLQPLFVLLAVAVTAWVIRGCRRERRLTMDAKLLVSGLLIVWMDPIGSWVQPQFFFNAYYVNFGSWVEHIPGWYSPHGRFQADLILVEFPLYCCLVVVAARGCAFMHWIRRRRPRTSTLTLVLANWALVTLFVMVFEEIFILRTGVAVWEEIPPVTIYAGTRYEMSLLPDPVFWGGVMVFMTYLRYSRNDRAQSLVEAGLDRVPGGAGRKAVISTFAVIGAVSCAMLLSSVLAITASLYSRTPDNLPSYILHGMCGGANTQPCPDPGVSVPRFQDR
jgi:hypothetical protein